MHLRSQFIVILSLTTSFAHAQSSTKDESTPDFCQTDKEGQFENGGRVFCGPVAISNSLMCLAETGYPALITKSDTPKKSQIELIRKLASPDYMYTHGTGTNTLRLMRGAKKYVAEHGYTCAQLEYRGWRKVNKELKPSEELPSIDWMATALTQPAGAACVNIGWYTYDEPTNTYNRRGGHWMTGTAAYAKHKDTYITLLDRHHAAAPAKSFIMPASSNSKRAPSTTRQRMMIRMTSTNRTTPPASSSSARASSPSNTTKTKRPTPSSTAWSSSC